MMTQLCGNKVLPAGDTGEGPLMPGPDGNDARRREETWQAPSSIAAIHAPPAAAPEGADDDPAASRLPSKTSMIALTGLESFNGPLFLQGTV